MGLLTSSAVILALGSGVGSTAVVDIDATSPAGVSMTLAAGTYQIDWIGTQNGGAYDGWQYNTATSGNFREVFSLSGGGQVRSFDRNDGNPNFNQYLDARTALADFSTGSGPLQYLVYSAGTDKNVSTSVVDGPLSFVVSQAASYTFTVPDYLWSDNTGGVSLRLTQTAAPGNQAVPEPAGLPLVATALAALAAAGVGRLVRQRRRG